MAAVTLCAAERDEPYVVVHGDRGRIRLTYTLDEVQVDDGPVRRFGRTDLLENLVEHLRSGARLLVPIRRTGAFMEVMEAIRVAPDPLPIAADHQDRAAEGRVLPGIALGGGHLRGPADALLGAGPELGRPAHRAEHGRDHRGRGLHHRPRPAPHRRPQALPPPGTDTRRRRRHRDAARRPPAPPGRRVAVTDLGGRNFWGGRAYVRDEGPAWLDDHGVQRHVSFTARDASGFTETLLWERPGEEPLVREERTVRAAPAARGWALDFAFTLRNLTGDPLSVRSSATKGRVGAGYGGFFWRAPAGSAGLRVFTAVAEGEERVHGSRAPWLALAADDWTLLFAQDDDPWFVRVAEYPGVGTAPGLGRAAGVRQELTRRLTVVVTDGGLSRSEAAAVAAAAGQVRSSGTAYASASRVPSAARRTGRPVAAERLAATPTITLRMPSRYPPGGRAGRRRRRGRHRRAAASPPPWPPAPAGMAISSRSSQCRCRMSRSPAAGRVLASARGARVDTRPCAPGSRDALDDLQLDPALGAVEGHPVALPRGVAVSE